MKKIFALVLALMLVLASVAALAATPANVPTPGTGKITVNNAVKGETYTIYKLFDAEVGANGAIIYKCTGDIPTGLSTYFTKDATTNIVTATAAAGSAGELSTAAIAALKTWAETATETTHTQATGNTVVFENLGFGYYVVTSSIVNNNASAIMVTSTNPEAVIYEKNEKTPQPNKEVDDHTWSIGDTITYTVTFPGINYKGTGENAEVVTTYTVTDTLPAFLTNATVTGITIGGEAQTVNDTNFPGVTTFGTNETFDIPWATYDATKPAGERWTSKYTNGTVVVVTYTAVLTDIVNVGDKKNINTVTVTRKTGKDNGEEEPTNEHWEDEEWVKTYGAAIEKVDGEGYPLAGAEFEIAGLTAVETAQGSGVYTVTKYDPTTVTTPTTLKVNAEGMIYIVGLQDALTLTITETKAPTGYNKLTAPTTLTTQQIGNDQLVKKITGYREYDNKGNLIQESVTEIQGVQQTDQDLSALTSVKVQVTNNKGTELPETGGIGTTLFYVGGGILVLLAVVLLVTKKRMGAND